MQQPDLESLSPKNIWALAKYLTKGVVSEKKMSTPDMLTFIKGRFGNSTIADAIRVLRASGQWEDSNTALNVQALQFGTKCSCGLLAGHDGPHKPVGGWKVPPSTSLPGSEDDTVPLLEGGTEEAKEPLPTPVPSDLQNAVKKLEKKLNSFVEVHVTRDELEGAMRVLNEQTQIHLSQIGKLLSDQAQGVTIQVTELTMPEFKAPVALKRRPHAAFWKVLALVRAGLNVMMIGPAGSGKTTIGEDIAIALQKPFAFESMTAGKPESALTGRLLPLGLSGAMRYVSSPFVCRFAGERVTIGDDGLVTCVPDDDEAGVVLLDEMDAADANMLLVVNAALANGMMTIEQRAASGLNVLIRKHKNNVIIAAANTFGTGMDLSYAGRNALDAAFLDRWYPVFVNYDPVLEAEIADIPAPDVPVWRPAPPPTQAEWRSLSRWILDVRDKCEKAKLKKVFGTRALLKARAARFAGIPSGEIKADLMLGWPPAHVAQVLGD